MTITTGAIALPFSDGRILPHSSGVADTRRSRDEEKPAIIAQGARPCANVPLSPVSTESIQALCARRCSVCRDQDADKSPGPAFLSVALGALSSTEPSSGAACRNTHGDKEFIKFLSRIERYTPVSRGIRVIANIDATRKHPTSRNGRLAGHSHRVFLFTPASASWLNAADVFLSIITRRRIRRGVFKSVSLRKAISRDLPRQTSPPAYVERVSTLTH
jgi:hypothetical protein